MRQLKTAAVILDTTDVFDADRSYLLFTRVFGKLHARARGVRKPSSRLAGHLLAFQPTQLELVETRDRYLVTQAVAESAAGEYPEAALRYLQAAEIIAEAMNVLFVEQSPHPIAFDGLVYTLERLRAYTANVAADVATVELITAEFLWKCLAELGFEPELERCVVSGEVIRDEALGWSSQLGGVIRQAALAQAPVLPQPPFRLTYPRTVLVLRQLLRPVFVAERLKVEVEVREEAFRVAMDFLQTITGRPLKSLAGW